MGKKACLLLLLTLLVLGEARLRNLERGRTLFIAPDDVVKEHGNVNPAVCSISRPCTLAEGLEHAQPGDTLKLADGRYKTNAVVKKHLEELTIRGQGAEKTSLESGGELNDDDVEVVLDIHAPQVLIRDLAIVINGSLAQHGRPIGPAPAPEPAAAPEPAEEPSEAPAEEPSEAPAEEPSEAPAEEPSDAPAEEPSSAPAEEPSAKRHGRSLLEEEDEEESDDERVAVFLRRTATRTTLRNLSIRLVNASKVTEEEVESGDGPKGILVHSTRNIIKKLEVVGKFQDAIHIASSGNKVKQVEITGARRTGILLASEPPVYPCELNQVVQTTIHNIGCQNSSTGTAIEVQGQQVKIKQVEIKKWGQYGIHICGDGGDCQKPCHFASGIPKDARTASQVVVKAAHFGKGNRTICNGADDTVFKHVKEEGRYGMPLTIQDALAGVVRMSRSVF